MSRIAYVDLVHEVAERLTRSARFPKPEALNIGLAVRADLTNCQETTGTDRFNSTLKVLGSPASGLLIVNAVDLGKTNDEGDSRVGLRAGARLGREDP